MFAEAFAVIATLAETLGVSSIKDLPGCWEHQLDERWWIAVNGRPTPTECSRGPVVMPYAAYVEFNGWPAASFTPKGGEFVAGMVANEEAFIEAAKAAIAQAQVLAHG